MDNRSKVLPYGRHSVTEDDILAVEKVLRSAFLTTGPVIDEFEQYLAQKTGADFAIACSSGTAALHLAAMAIDIGPGDSVVVPATTFLATANAVRYTGAEVVFSDVDSENGLITKELLVEAINRANTKIKAVFPVHLGGQVPALPAIYETAKENGAVLVEDCSHSIGGKYLNNKNQEMVGSCKFSELSTFSFHPVKTVAMGEGGAITTNSEKLAKRVKSLLNHGMIRDPAQFKLLGKGKDNNPKQDVAEQWIYEMHELGFNYRTSDINCALGLSQLKRLNNNVERRRELVDYYDRLLLELAPVVVPIKRAVNNFPSWHLYQVLIDFESLSIKKAEIVEKLRLKGIVTQVHYIPVPYQPYYQNRYGKSKYSGAEKFYNNSLSLPLFASMDNSDVERVVAALIGLIGIEA